MAKKTAPIITHTEIISRAIRSITDEIADWLIKCESLPQPIRDETIQKATEPLQEKLDALKELYRIETGTDYC